MFIHSLVADAQKIPKADMMSACGVILNFFPAPNRRKSVELKVPKAYSFDRKACLSLLLLLLSEVKRENPLFRIIREILDFNRNEYKREREGERGINNDKSLRSY